MSEYTRYFVVNERTDGSGADIGLVRANKTTTRFQRWQRTPGRWVDSPWDMKWIKPMGEIDPHFEEIDAVEALELVYDNDFHEITDERLAFLQARWDARED